VATVLVTAIVVPYVGYLVDGSMPFVEDPRGMAGVGLVLGAAAYMLLRGGEEPDRGVLVESYLATGALALGVVAIAFGETAAAEVLLAVFMVSIVAVFAVMMLDHAGVLHWHGPAPTH
jgi:hypothetical protein